MRLNNLLYHNTCVDVGASNERIEITLKGSPVEPLMIALDGRWRGDKVERMNGLFFLAEAGTYLFQRTE
jgi:hypothetical protein